MSKMDNLRAMREAKYEKARAARPAVAPARSAAAMPVAPAAPAAPASVASEPASEPVGERLCGHKNMSGRTCTREHGHAEKSHRYS